MAKERRLPSVIDAFIDTTTNLASPTIFRRWIGISMIASVCQQRVWVKTSRPIYPNFYTICVAHPGVGKTRPIIESKHILAEVKGVHIAPVSVTFASLVDNLKDAGVELLVNPGGKIVFNSMSIIADELGAFVSKYDNEMIAGLTAFYEPTPYGQSRRTGGHDNMGIKIQIDAPQLNILCGSTPSNLINFLPENAWGQGFTSRLMLVFSDERTVIDDFADFGAPKTADIIHDLRIINTLYGKFTVSEAYRAAVNAWKDSGLVPIPYHPRLEHYCTRRPVHLYKLSMIASLNRDNALVLTEEDFFTAIGWLVEAETMMPDIFKAGATNADSSAMDEIIHFIRVTNIAGTGVSEHRIMNFARERIPLTSLPRIIEIMEGAGQINCVRRDKHTGARYFTAGGDANIIPLRKATP